MNGHRVKNNVLNPCPSSLERPSASSEVLFYNCYNGFVACAAAMVQCVFPALAIPPGDLEIIRSIEGKLATFLEFPTHCRRYIIFVR